MWNTKYKYTMVDGAMIKLWAIQGVASRWCWSALIDCSPALTHTSSRYEIQNTEKIQNTKNTRYKTLNTKYKYKRIKGALIDCSSAFTHSKNAKCKMYNTSEVF